MRKAIFHMIILLISARAGFAQTGVYIPPKADIAAYSGDTVAIFINLKKEGNFV